MLSCSETFQDILPCRFDPAHGFHNELDLRITGYVINIRRDDVIEIFVSFPAVSCKDLYYFNAAGILCVLISTASDRAEAHDRDFHMKYLRYVDYGSESVLYGKTCNLFCCFFLLNAAIFGKLHKILYIFLACSVSQGQMLRLCPRYENTCL